MFIYRDVHHGETAAYSTVDWSRTRALWECREEPIEEQHQSTDIVMGNTILTYIPWHPV